MCVANGSALSQSLSVVNDRSLLHFTARRDSIVSPCHLLVRSNSLLITLLAAFRGLLAKGMDVTCVEEGVSQVDSLILSGCCEAVHVSFLLRVRCEHVVLSPSVQASDPYESVMFACGLCVAYPSCVSSRSAVCVRVCVCVFVSHVFCACVGLV